MQWILFRPCWSNGTISSIGVWGGDIDTSEWFSLINRTIVMSIRDRVGIVQVAG